MHRLALVLVLTLTAAAAEAQPVTTVRPVARPTPSLVGGAPRDPRPAALPSTSSSAPGSSAHGTRPAADTQPAPAPARPGILRCVALDNGVGASAALEVRRTDNSLVARGSCARLVELPAGTYLATITFEDALDKPTRTVTVRVAEGTEAIARASFETAILEVRFTADRQPVHGLAVVRKDGRELGSLGSGVTARVSAGTYQITARYRTREHAYTVTLAPGQRRALRADF